MKILLVLLLFALSACEKIEISENGNSKPSFDFDVPANFSWNVHKSVNVSVTIADQYNGEFDYGVEIYDDGELLESGFVKGDEVFAVVVDVKNICSYLTVVQIDPNGDRVKEGVSINGSSIVLDFDAVRSPLMRSMVSGSGVTIPENAIEVPDDRELESGGVYVISKFVANLDDVDDVTLYIAPGGIYQITEDTEWTEAEIYVCPGGRLVGVTTEDEFENVRLYNHGEVNIYGDLEFEGGAFFNYSETYVYNLKLSEGAELEVYGLLMAGVIFPEDALEETDFDDIGEMEFEDAKVTIGEGGLLRAKCIEAKDVDMDLKPHAWIWADEEVKCEGTEIVEINSDDDKYADKYAVILADKITVDEKDDVAGRVVLDATSGIDFEEGDSGSWDENIEIDRPDADVVSIPATYYNILKYNDGGYNAKDPDSLPKPDGIVYFEPTYTIIMEDGYPGTGDMDMNDIVCEWQLGLLTDDDEKVTKLGLNYTVKALGGTRELAAAVALTGLEHTDIKSVKLSKDHSFGRYFTLNKFGVESQNSDVVIPLFENAHATCFGESVPVITNTFKITKDSYNFNVEIEFNTPIQRAKISRSDIDFFIVIDGNEKRRTEIHLYGNSPTAKASNSQAVFNNKDIVWGVEQVKGFAYPKELISISNAYLRFEGWVKSGGEKNQNWYKYPEEDKVIKSSK